MAEQACLIEHGVVLKLADSQKSEIKLRHYAGRRKLIMDNQNLLRGIEEAKKGNYEGAVNFLAKVVQSDPMNVEGWLLLGHCLSDIEKRRYCYERVLGINPQNEAAKISLAKLDTHQGSKQSPPGLKLTPAYEKTTANSLEEKSPVAERPKRGGVLGAFALGLILALVVCALPSALLIMGGRLDGFLSQYLMTDTARQPYPTAAISPPENQGDVDFYIAKARGSMENNDYGEAIDYLNKVIEFSPENYPAYYLRAKCFYNLNNDEHSLDVYNSNLWNALADIDMAIALQPTEAEYYTLRRDTLVDLSTNLPYQIDREYLFKLAIENDRMFISLSPSLERRLYVSTFLANDLIDSGQCEEGMQVVKDLEGKILPGDDGKYGCLMCARAVGYACLGDMDEAVESMDEAILRSNARSKSRTYYKSLYLYQAGRKDEALAVLNESINEDPTFGGARYYVRSLIYLEMGNRDQAEKDLQMGEIYSWEREELYAYINGKLALEDGNEQDAVYWLQIAEASLYPHSSVLKKRIQEELAQLGVEPLERSLSIGFQATPMPTTAP
jgi:tetratricopeptide (TPR) repeat protein